MQNGDDHDYWNKLVELIIKSGLADEDSQLKYHCDTYLETNDFRGLKKFIERHQETVQEARIRLLKEEVTKIPYKAPSHEEAQTLAGPIKIGLLNNTGDFVCLTPEMFTEKVLFFGEPGTGKNHTIANTLLQLLSIEKEGIHNEKKRF